MKKKKEVTYGILPPGFYVVEKLLDKRKVGKINQYLVSWAGWGSEEYAWLDEKDLPKYFVSKFETYLKSRAHEHSKIKRKYRKRKLAPKLLPQNIMSSMQTPKRKGKKVVEREMPQLDVEPLHWENRRNTADIADTSTPTPAWHWPLYESGRRPVRFKTLTAHDLDNDDPVEADEVLESGSVSRKVSANDLHIPELTNEENIESGNSSGSISLPDKSISPEAIEYANCTFNLIGILSGWSWNIPPGDRDQNDNSSEPRSIGGTVDSTMEKPSLAPHGREENSNIQDDFDFFQEERLLETDQTDALENGTAVRGSYGRFEPQAIEGYFSSPPGSPESELELEDGEIMREVRRVNLKDGSQPGRSELLNPEREEQEQRLLEAGDVEGTNVREMSEPPTIEDYFSSAPSSPESEVEFEEGEIMREVSPVNLKDVSQSGRSGFLNPENEGQEQQSLKAVDGDGTNVREISEMFELPTIEDHFSSPPSSPESEPEFEGSEIMREVMGLVNSNDVSQAGVSGLLSAETEGQEQELFVLLETDVHGDGTEVRESFESPTIEEYFSSSTFTEPEIIVEVGRVDINDISLPGGSGLYSSEAVGVCNYLDSFGSPDPVDDSLPTKEEDEASDDIQVLEVTSSIHCFQNSGYSEVFNPSPVVFRPDADEGYPPTMMRRTLFSYRRPECYCDCHRFNVERNTKVDTSSYGFDDANDLNDYETTDHVESEEFVDSGFLSTEVSQSCSCDLCSNNQTIDIDESKTEFTISSEAWDEDGSYDEVMPDSTTNETMNEQDMVCTCADCAEERGENLQLQQTVRCIRPDRTQIFSDGKVLSLDQEILDNVEGQQLDFILGVVNSVFNGHVVVCRFIGISAWQLVRTSLFREHFPQYLIAYYQRVLITGGVLPPVFVPIPEGFPVVQEPEVGSTSDNGNVSMDSGIGEPEDDMDIDEYENDTDIVMVAISVGTQTQSQDVTGGYNSNMEIGDLEEVSISVGTQTQPQDITEEYVSDIEVMDPLLVKEEEDDELEVIYSNVSSTGVRYEYDSDCDPIDFGNASTESGSDSE